MFSGSFRVQASRAAAASSRSCAATRSKASIWPPLRRTAVANGAAHVFSKQMSTADDPGSMPSPAVGGILVAEQAAACALEHDQVVLAVAVDVGDLQAGDRAVELLRDGEDVEHADDAAVDEVDEQRDGLAGARRVRRVADDDDVDGSEFQVLCAHCATSLI